MEDSDISSPAAVSVAQVHIVGPDCCGASSSPHAIDSYGNELADETAVITAEVWNALVAQLDDAIRPVTEQIANWAEFVS